MTRTLRDLLAARPRTLVEVSSAHPVSQALDALHRYRVSSAIVRGADGRLVGLISPHEARARLVELCRDAHSTRVGSVMTPLPTPLPVAPELPLDDAGRLLGRYATHYLVVADADEVIAVVSDVEIAAAVEDEEMDGAGREIDEVIVQRDLHGPSDCAPETYTGLRVAPGRPGSGIHSLR